MKSYFFIPANKLEKLSKIDIKSNLEIIIDLEDAITNKERLELSLKVLNDKSHIVNWVRLPLHGGINELDLLLINQFLNKGFTKFVLPKLMNISQWESIYNLSNDFMYVEFIILIEHPRLLLDIEKILRNERYTEKIIGLALGSHDLMNHIGASHNELTLTYPRLKALYIAKAFNKLAIDIASMNIRSNDLFQQELHYGFENGFDGKFIIHPKQLDWFNSYFLKDNKLFIWAKTIVDQFPNGADTENIKPFILNGEIIEKPHVIKALSILKNIIN
jgi:citrate lyase beta subunit